MHAFTSSPSLRKAALMVAGVLSAFPALTTAWDAPDYSGFTRVWQETFSGDAGSAPDSSVWTKITNFHVNNELQDYTTSNANMQLSGGNTLQIIPLRDSSASNGWTSARIESSYTFTPAAGKVTLAEADIRFGDNSNQQGIWPAFWILGNSNRNGVTWPFSGEIDILERINGAYTGYGTLHCDVNPGGVCNELSGLSSTVTIPDNSWHTWSVRWDRTTQDWYGETITWYMDGQQYHSIMGATLNSESAWDAVCHDPLYFILNVAVGGTMPGNPTDSTQDGFGSDMEVAYVAVYESN